MKMNEKQGVQYAVTAPGAPMTDYEWNPIAHCIRKWERLHCTPITSIRDAINAVLAKRNVEQLELHDAMRTILDIAQDKEMELVVKVLHIQEFITSGAYMPEPVADAPPADGDMVDQMLLCLPGSKRGKRSESLRWGMAEAARIPLYRMLGPVTPEECKDISGLDWKAATAQLINLRVERILKPKKQTPTEMVVEAMAKYDVIGNTEMMAAEIIEKLEVQW